MAEYNDNDKYYIGEVLTEENLNNVWQYILTLLEVNGGEGSLINADLLDGHHASDFTLKSEVIDSTIQPNFYIGESVLRNEREEDKQFLLTEDVLLKNIHGWSSLGSLLEGFFQDTSSDNKYRSYYNDLIRKLNDYTTTNGNLENDQNKNLICKNRGPEIYFDPLNSLPLDGDIWETPNINHNIPDYIPLLDGSEPTITLSSSPQLFTCQNGQCGGYGQQGYLSDGWDNTVDWELTATVKTSRWDGGLCLYSYPYTGLNPLDGEDSSDGKNIMSWIDGSIKRVGKETTGINYTQEYNGDIKITKIGNTISYYENNVLKGSFVWNDLDKQPRMYVGTNTWGSSGSVNYLKNIKVSFENTRDIKINEEEKCLELSNFKIGDIFTLYGKKLTIGSKISFLIKSNPTLSGCQIRFSDNFNNIVSDGPGLDIFYSNPNIPKKDGYLKLSFYIEDDGKVYESTYGKIFNSGHYFSLAFKSTIDSPIFIKNLKIEDSIQNPCITETYLPIKGDNPDIENKIPQLISNILDGVENWNSDSGGYKFNQNKIDKKLTTLLNSIISMMVLDLLDSKNHDDRISDIEVFTNKHFGVSIRDMIKHIQNENYDFITYECLDDNGLIAETRCGYKLDADSVNGIQIVPITQEGFNNLPEDIQNSWRYYFVIKDEQFMPSEEEYVSPVYNLVSSEFKVKFSLDNNIIRDDSRNIVGGTLDLMYSINESNEKNHLISVFDFNEDQNNSLISKEYLSTLLDGVFTNLEKEKISLDEIRTAIEKTQNIDETYENQSNKSFTINSLSNNEKYPTTKAVYDFVDSFAQVQNYEINKLKDELDYMKEKIMSLESSLGTLDDKYLQKSVYEDDMSTLKECLESILE